MIKRKGIMDQAMYEFARSSNTAGPLTFHWVLIPRPSVGCDRQLHRRGPGCTSISSIVKASLCKVEADCCEMLKVHGSFCFKVSYSKSGTFRKEMSTLQNNEDGFFFCHDATDKKSKFWENIKSKKMAASPLVTKTKLSHQQRPFCFLFKKGQQMNAHVDFILLEADEPLVEALFLWCLKNALSTVMFEFSLFIRSSGLDFLTSVHRKVIFRRIYNSGGKGSRIRSYWSHKIPTFPVYGLREEQWSCKCAFGWKKGSNRQRRRHKRITFTNCSEWRKMQFFVSVQTHIHVYLTWSRDTSQTFLLSVRKTLSASFDVSSRRN